MRTSNNVHPCQTIHDGCYWWWQGTFDDKSRHVSTKAWGLLRKVVCCAWRYLFPYVFDILRSSWFECCQVKLSKDCTDWGGSKVRIHNEREEASEASYAATTPWSAHIASESSASGKWRPMQWRSMFSLLCKIWLLYHPVFLCEFKDCGGGCLRMLFLCNDCWRKKQ
jgi:hypothetical protein